MRTILYNNTLVTLAGNESFLYRRLTAFLVSRNPTMEVVGRINDWVLSLEPEEMCVMCGESSAIEREVVEMLLCRGIPVIVVLGRTLRASNSVQYIQGYNEAIYSGRVLILSPIDDAEMNNSSVQTMQMRNEWMIKMSHEVVVGCVKPHGHLDYQLQGYEKVRVLSTSVSRLSMPTEAYTLRMQAEQHGREICNTLRCETLSSQTMRKLLVKYLNLPTDRPSALHSDILLVVLEKYSMLEDFDFTAFFRLWDWRNLRGEDYESVFRDNHRQMSLAECVVERLINVMPKEGYRPYNKSECFDALTVGNILFFLLRHSTQEVSILKAAKQLALYNQDMAAEQYYNKMIDECTNK